MWHNSSVFVIISLSDEVMWGLLFSLEQHICASSHMFLEVMNVFFIHFLTSISLPPKLPPFFSTFSSVYMYTYFSCFPPYCQPCHLLISPLPCRVRSRVLTLGFVQICSLREWKVVMRAKKNSLALSLTTKLVFLMKPNENSIFCPCYPLPSP